MRIWMHLTLQAVGTFGGFFCGGLALSAFLELIRGAPRWVTIPTIILTVVPFVYGGMRIGEGLARLLPARCPECRGRAYAEGHRPIRFRCRVCGLVHRANVRTNWGKQ